MGISVGALRRGIVIGRVNGVLMNEEMGVVALFSHLSILISASLRCTVMVMVIGCVEGYGGVLMGVLIGVDCYKRKGCTCTVLRT